MSQSFQVSHEIGPIELADHGLLDSIKTAGLWVILIGLGSVVRKGGIDLISGIVVRSFLYLNFHGGL